MSKEGILYAIGIVGLLSVGAFSKDSRKSIWKRDKGKSVWSGETEGLTVAHINHDKTSPKYDDPDNGRLLTNREQYIDHFNRHGTVSIGLTEPKNKQALGILYHSLDDKQREGLPKPIEAGTKAIPLPKKNKPHG